MESPDSVLISVNNCLMYFIFESLGSIQKKGPVPVGICANKRPTMFVCVFVCAHGMEDGLPPMSSVSNMVMFVTAT